MALGPGIARTPLPIGFFCSGVNSGVRRYRPDLGLIHSDSDCVAVGVFTRNECKAAPITYSQGVLPSKHIRAVITNSGQANAATGKDGMERNWQMAVTTSEWLGCKPHQVLTASTGVIGVPLDIEKIKLAIPNLIERSGDSAEPFSLAILTTDLVPKTVTTTVELSSGTIRITGIAKGSGMIHPNMATMLGYLLTDAPLEIPFAEEALHEAVDQSFNMISVDGDTSTNDCVFLLANGRSKVKPLTSSDQKAFKNALNEISRILAQAIARDGEGASKLIEVELKNAPSLELARKAAKQVIVSPLVKTAVHGEDPNWGRVLAALGAAGVPAPLFSHMSLTLQGIPLFDEGAPLPFDRISVRKLMKTDTVRFVVDLKEGSHSATAWGCDLTRGYIDINTEYS